MIKNLPAMQETWIRSLGQEDCLEKGMATHFSILAGEFPGQRSLVDYSPWGCRLGHDWATNAFTSTNINLIALNFRFLSCSLPLTVIFNPNVASHSNKKEKRFSQIRTSSFNTSISHITQVFLSVIDWITRAHNPYYMNSIICNNLELTLYYIGKGYNIQYKNTELYCWPQFLYLLLTLIACDVIYSDFVF